MTNSENRCPFTSFLDIKASTAFIT